MENSSLLDTFVSCPPSFLNADVALDEVSVLISVLVVPLGLILGFFGCRLPRISYFICGFICGSLITYAIIRDQVDNMHLPFEGMVGIAAAGGFLLGLAGLGVQVLGLFIVGMNASFLIAACAIGVVAHFLTFDERWSKQNDGSANLMFSSPFSSRWLPIGCILLTCLLGGLVSLLRPKYVLLVASSLIGSAIIFLTFGYYLEIENPLRPVRFIAAAIVGTRYMQTHYGRYSFGYFPAQTKLENLSYKNEGYLLKQSKVKFNWPNASSFLIPGKTTTSTTTVSTTPVVEKVNVVPTFLCWSDFVLLACWLLLAAIFGLIQSIFVRTSQRKINGRRIRSRKKPRASKKKNEISREVVQGEQVGDNIQSSRFDNLESWFSNTVNEENTAQNTSLATPAVVPFSGNHDGRITASQWVSVMTRPTSSGVSAPITSSTVQHMACASKVSHKKGADSFVISDAGHIHRLRRTVGDVLSRDFVRNCSNQSSLPLHEVSRLPSSSHR